MKQYNDSRNRRPIPEAARPEVQANGNGHATGIEPERALLVGIAWPALAQVLANEYLDELDMLAQTAGAAVVGRELVRMRTPDPALLIGKGKAEELAGLVDELKADLVVFDDDLAPAQVRNLEKIIGRRILDRSGLILDIFAHRARTREAKTQVELAQLRYLLPRLAGAWTHLERQRGGIGLRGPGETQIETDRRIIRSRIRQLNEELEHIEQNRRQQRAGREATFRFALAGYTNVGKSTLMNVLTQAGVYEENLLFATLDSTTRMLQLTPKSNTILTDTVGFIRKLPPHLVASFRSTLAEIREADCILHVVDIASLSFREQMTEVEKILEEMEVAQIPRLHVFNKVDALEDDVHIRWAQAEYPDGIFLSARTGQGVDRLLEAMREVANRAMAELTVEIPVQDGRRLAELHRVAEVLDEQVEDSHVRMRIRLPRIQALRLGLGVNAEG